MEMDKFLCSCLNIDGAVIDKICDDFDIDIDEEDVLELLNNKSQERLKNVGSMLLVRVLEIIISDYPQLNRNKFDYDVSSPSYPDFYYDGERFSTKEELDSIAERKMLV